MEKRFQDPDSQFIYDFVSGEASAFEKLLKRYKNLVLNVAYRFLQDRTEAEDAAQDVFLRIYRSAKSYKPQAKFSTWVYKITANVCLNRLREKKRMPKAFQSVDPGSREEHRFLLNGAVGSSSSPPMEFEKKELEKIVKAALQALPSGQRMAVILKKNLGLSYKEIAEILGCSMAAVDSLLQRAKNNLRKALRPYFHE